MKKVIYTAVLALAIVGLSACAASSVNDNTSEASSAPSYKATRASETVLSTSTTARATTNSTAAELTTVVATTEKTTTQPATTKPIKPVKDVSGVSNLISKDSQKYIDDLLKKAGVCDEKRDCFFNHVNQFNEAVDTSKLATDFVDKDPLNNKYDPYEYQDQWYKKYPDFDGYNCRITAFSLFSDYIIISPKGEIRDNNLFIDRASLEYDDSALDNSDLDSFLRLYSLVPTEATTDVSRHAEIIKSDWDKRGISFKNNKNMSLITVWFHDQWSEDENELSVGHAGVLINDGDRFCFVEKIAFQEPYQATYFNSKSELCDYLMKKYDVSWGQETARPFIMENDQLLG